MSSHEPITVKVYMSQEQHRPSLEPNISNTLSKPSQTPVASSDKMAQLYSLSMRDLLAQAHHLSGLPSFESNLPKKSSKPSKSSGLKKPLEAGKPSGQTCPHFDSIAAARYKKTANRV